MPLNGYVSKGALLTQGMIPSARGEDGSFAVAHKCEWRRKPNPVATYRAASIGEPNVTGARV